MEQCTEAQQLFLLGEQVITGGVLDGQLIGVQQFAFTWGLVVNIRPSPDAPERRYCYSDLADAVAAMLALPSVHAHPADNKWIKCKGAYRGKHIDMLNPKLEA